MSKSSRQHLREKGKFYKELEKVAREQIDDFVENGKYLPIDIYYDESDYYDDLYFDMEDDYQDNLDYYDLEDSHSCYDYYDYYDLEVEYYYDEPGSY